MKAFSASEGVGSRVVVIHQPNYLPGLTFFDKLARADILVLLDTAEYTKNNWINRNRVKTSKGAAWLTVPVASRGHSHSAIREMRTVQTAHWERTHWQTLQSNYGRAPYFPTFGPQLQDVFGRSWPMLADINEHLIRLVAAALHLTTDVVRASDLPVAGTRTQRLVEICRAVDASTYLSGPGGRKYMEENLFDEHGTRVAFHQFRHPDYPQQFGAFVPDLSVIDALFNVGYGCRELLGG